MHIYIASAFYASILLIITVCYNKVVVHKAWERGSACSYRMYLGLGMRYEAGICTTAISMKGALQ